MDAKPTPAPYKARPAASAAVAPRSSAVPLSPPPSSSLLSSPPLSWLLGAVTWLFGALGAYVGVVQATAWCGADLLFTMAARWVAVPIVFFDMIAGLYKQEYELGRERSRTTAATDLAGPSRRSRKKLAEPPVATMMMRGEAVGAPAGAGGGDYAYGATGRGLLA
jgi:hypothetical protein